MGTAKVQNISPQENPTVKKTPHPVRGRGWGRVGRDVQKWHLEGVIRHPYAACEMTVETMHCGPLVPRGAKKADLTPGATENNKHSHDNWDAGPLHSGPHEASNGQACVR